MKSLLVVLLIALFVPSIAEASRPAPSWGVDRIDQENLPLDGTYSGTGDGTGVRIYVVGSGVASTSEFSGRLLGGYGPAGDCQGTGTAAASVAAGNSYGIATDATVVPVRVRDCSGTLGSVAAGLDWIAANHPAQTTGIVLVETTAPLSFLVNDSAEALLTLGLPVIAAAGNEGYDACSNSPAQLAGVLAVGATTSSDARASFSNRGSCLDIWAPGEGVSASGPGGPAVFSGTNVAAGHVAGVAALLAERGNPGSSLQNQILSRALPDRVSDPQSAADDLLFIGDLREGEAVRYSAPVISSSPPLAEGPTVSWNFSGGTYADGNRSGTWLHNVLWDGESFDTELVCVLRNSLGQLQREVVVAREGDTEPSTCSLGVSGLADGSYFFGVRKDLVSGTRRFEGSEARAPLAINFQGPEVSWEGSPTPALSSGEEITYTLRISDYEEITGVAAADFLQKGTAAECVFLPSASSLPAGGGTLEVAASCSGSGTVQPEVRSNAFQSAGRFGPAAPVAATLASFDRQAPETSWVTVPPASVAGNSLQIQFTSSETSSFACSLQYGEWETCSSPYLLQDLVPGSYNIRVRATDQAGNEDPIPLSHSFVASDPPPPRPPHDNFASAEELLPYQEGTNRNATRQQGEPSHGFGAWRSVWYKWTAPENGDLDLWTSGSRLDTALMVYSGSSLGGLQKLASNDDWQGNSWSRVSVSVQKGQEIRLALAGAWAAEGPYELRTRFYPYGKLPPRSQIVSMRRISGGVQLQLGTRGLGAPHSFQCFRSGGWKQCSGNPIWKGLRRGKTYTLRVRTVSEEGLPEKQPSQIRFRF